MSTVEDSRKRNTGQRQSATPRNGSQLPQQVNRKGGRNSQPVNKPANTSNNNASTPVNSANSPSVSAPPRPLQDDYSPIAGYNAAEVEDMLKKGYDPKAQQYKPEQNSSTTNSNTAKTPAWGMKPGAMASGKDFWLELRKQVTELQKGDGNSKGG